MLSYLLQAKCGQWFHASLFLVISLDNSPAGASITTPPPLSHTHTHTSTHRHDPQTTQKCTFPDPSSLIPGIFQHLSQQEPVTGLQMYQMYPAWWTLDLSERHQPGPIKDRGGRTRAPSTAITAQHQLLSLQALPTSLDCMEVSFSFGLNSNLPTDQSKEGPGGLIWMRVQLIKATKVGQPNSFLFYTFTSHDGICSHWHIPNSHPQQFQRPQSVALQRCVFNVRSRAAALSCTFTRKRENTNPDTCRHSCDSSDGRWWGGGGLTYLLMIFRSRLKSIFNTAARRLQCAAAASSSPWVLVNATWCGAF